MTFLNAEDTIPGSHTQGLSVHTLVFTGFKKQEYYQVTVVFFKRASMTEGKNQIQIY